jgi:hypothetical protein
MTEDVTEGNTTWFFGTAVGGETSAAFSFASTASARFIIYAVVDNAGSISHGYGAGGVTLPATGTYTFTNDTTIPAGSLRMAMTWKFASATATADSVVGGSIYRNWFSSRFLWLSQDDQSGTSDTLEVSMDTDVTSNNVSTVIFSP